MSESNNVACSIDKESERYANSRKFAYIKKGNKKVTTENLKQEIIVARILGEMNSAERVVQSLVQNPDGTREDLEAELHQFVVDCNNTVATFMGSSQIIGIEDVLKMHGYYKERTNE